MRWSAASILATSLRWRSRARSSMARSVSDDGVILILILKVLQCLPGFLQDVLLPRHEFVAEIIPLTLVHKGFFVGGAVVLFLLQQRHAHSLQALKVAALYRSDRSPTTAE